MALLALFRHRAFLARRPDDDTRRTGSAAAAPDNARPEGTIMITNPWQGSAPEPRGGSRSPPGTAVIAIDIQNDFFADSGVFAAAGRDMSLARERLPNMIRLMRRAQESGLFTVFIRQVTLPGGGGAGDKPGLAASQGPRREEPGLHPCRILGGGFSARESSRAHMIRSSRNCAPTPFTAPISI